MNPVASLLVIGTGSAGYRHLMNARAAGVAKLSVLSTGAGVQKGPLPDGIRVESDLERAVSRGIEAVVIANPTSMHLASALWAARAGCHLLIEKPLSHTLTDVEQVQDEVSKRGLVATVGYQFRFHPSLRQIRRWLQEEAIGEIVSAGAVWGEYLPGWQPWRDYRTSYSARSDLGGGALLTLSHPMDYLTWLLGRVTCVSALTARRSGLDVDVEDTALVHLGFESGVIASVSLDYLQRPQRHSLTIIGRSGVIRWDNANGTAILDAVDRHCVVQVPERFERNDLFVAELNHFFDSIAGPSEPACGIEDGKQTLRLCLAAKESAQTGRRVDV